MKSGNLCVDILANFPGNFPKIQTFWSLNFPTIGVQLLSLKNTIKKVKSLPHILNPDKIHINPNFRRVYILVTKLIELLTTTSTYWALKRTKNLPQHQCRQQRCINVKDDALSIAFHDDPVDESTKDETEEEVIS